MEDSETYRFEVADNGIGIEEQYHDKIFASHFTLKIPDRYHKKDRALAYQRPWIWSMP